MGSHQKDLCATCMPIFCKCFCLVVCRGQWKSVWRQTKSSLLSPPSNPHPPFPCYFSLLSLHPKSGMQHHVQNFPFPLSISRITWSLWLRSCSGLLFCTSLLSVNFEPLLTVSGWECYVFSASARNAQCWDITAQLKSPLCPSLMKNIPEALFHPCLSKFKMNHSANLLFMMS